MLCRAKLMKLAIPAGNHYPLPEDVRDSPTEIAGRIFRVVYYSSLALRGVFRELTFQPGDEFAKQSIATRTGIMAW